MRFKFVLMLIGCALLFIAEIAHAIISDMEKRIAEAEEECEDNDG